MPETRVPAIVSPTDENLLQVARQIKGLLEVREGLAGDPLDANVTFRDLIAAGLAQDNSASNGGTTPGGGGVVVPPVVPPINGYNPTTDLTPPPKPTNLRATGLFAMVKLEWDGPVYKNHAYTEVWRSDDDVIGNAVLIGTAASVAMYGDYLGTSGGAYYWIRFVSQANVTGPWNDVSGTYGATSDSPEFLLELLSGEITSSQLYADLAARIDSIDRLALDLLAEEKARRLAGVESARQLLTETDARKSADGTINAALALTNSSLSTNTAAIATEVINRTSADSSLAQVTTAMVASFSGNASAILAESLTRADADSTTASLTTSLASSFAGNAAAIRVETSTRADADSVLSAQTLTLSAAFGSNSAALVAESTARADAVSAVSSVSQSLAAGVGSNIAGLAAESVTRADANSALSSITQALVAATGSNSAGISTEAKARTDSAAALASQITSMGATVGASSAAIKSEATTRADQDAATAILATALAAQAGNNLAAIKSEESVRATNEAAVSSSITTLQSTTGNTSVKLQTLATTTAGPDGLTAQYTIKIDNAGRVSGFGLSSQSNTATGSTSAFGVRADRFWVAAPADFSQNEPPTATAAGQVWYWPSANATYRWSGTAWVAFEPVVPFVVQTTPTTINGKSVPAGVYMNSAFIKNGTINTAHIGVLTADAISAGLTSSIDITSGTFASGRLYVGGTIVYTQTNGVATSINTVTNPNVAITAAGASFDVGYFKIKNPGDQSTIAPFEVVGGVTRITNAAIGTATITSANIADYIQSTDFNGTVSGNSVSDYGTLGWYISKKDGFGIFNSIRLRGKLEGNVGVTNQVVQVGRGVGLYSTHHGLTLSETDYNNAFVRNSQTGDVHFNVGLGSANYMTFTTATGVLSIKGKLTADAIDAVDTLNVKGNAVTAADYAEADLSNINVTGTATDVLTKSFSVSGLNTGENAAVIYICTFSSNLSGSSRLFMFQVFVNGTLNQQYPVWVGNPGTTTMSSKISLAAGNHTITCKVYAYNNDTGNANVGAKLTLLSAKR